MPLFCWLAAAADGDAPNWNFHKYLVGRDGKLIASYGANQNPSDDPLKQQIIDALGHLTLAHGGPLWNNAAPPSTR